ncbi:3-dehydroquinate synthase [Campylobacter corcagiensis]|uniref:3-dehydroquinate synthase n=1 Tax=Campylobacter corcagiensis TaxID=1448857 RepID=A0A7M1LEQ3_9BACT|nr:3-dehydroquinate synthase [Campylobacter corcagiensis]QKF64790.1 3-dehydroquinate synthase [Campylobacter corcagiensis]QOQ87047.1 3-dehydroquinate synthase [Campylobacter corcagiensis]
MTVDINLDKNSYKIYINELENLEFDGSVGVVTNQTVGALWLADLLGRIKAKSVTLIAIPDGEAYKNLDTLNLILEQLFNAKLDRKSTLIALGGGVVSDITGFAASIYQRGIDFINIPTTLLSMVDASVGGKTGINNKFGKNLIGSFYQPKAVYCHTKYLKTLPNREFSAGVAEAIKMAVMFDGKFFEFFKKSDLKAKDDVIYLIEKCVKIKADIVNQDEKESGIRAVLNYGHTFAHVIENQTNYSKFLHGEAVAIGINMANNLAQKLGLLSKDESKQVREVLEKFSLPVSYKIKDTKNFYEHFKLDKKSLNSKIKFILPNGIGNFKIKDDVKEELVIQTLKEFI